jgi:23S rRNA pseudouridine1911/1915/1917 synthase
MSLSDLVPNLDAAADVALLTRQALHAHRIRFKHPRTGKVFEAEAPLPEEMRKTLEVLRQHRAL